MNFDEVLRSVLGAGLTVSDAECARLGAHFELLKRWNARLNLTAIREAEEMVVRHFAESIWLSALLPEDLEEIADVGSGGGFPGLPIAVVRPETRVILVESHRRKAVFLREAGRGLRNVEVIDQRLEDAGREFEWLVSRGVNWVEFRPGLASFCRNAALLLGREDAQVLAARGELEWSAPVEAPWGRERVALVGHRRST